jgi:hypothetical protein
MGTSLPSKEQENNVIIVAVTSAGYRQYIPKRRLAKWQTISTQQNDLTKRN